MQCHWLLLGRENPASVPSEHLIHSVDFPTFLLPLLLHSQWKSQHGILVLSSSVFGLLTVSVVLSCFVCLFWVDRRLPFPNTRCYIMKTQTVTRRKAGITQTNTPYLCLWCGVFKGMAVFVLFFCLMLSQRHVLLKVKISSIGNDELLVIHFVFFLLLCLKHCPCVSSVKFVQSGWRLDFAIYVAPCLTTFCVGGVWRLGAQLF